jgi:hypothetical protein
MAQNEALPTRIKPPMEEQRVTLKMIDRSAGYEAKPDRVRLAELARFTQDVQAFIRGNGGEIDTSALEVAVVDGSVGIEANIFGAPKFFHDLQALYSGPLLDSIDSKRREIIESWQKIARKYADRAFELIAPFMNRPIVINASSDFHADDADQWVRVERYIRGTIENLGGATKPNAHVRLPDGSMLVVQAERAMLRDDNENRLFHTAMLRVRAEFNVSTRDLRNAQLIEFVEYSSQVDEAHLKRLRARGAEAWKDVDDPTGWVDELRGGRA